MGVGSGVGSGAGSGSGVRSRRREPRADEVVGLVVAVRRERRQAADQRGVGVSARQAHDVARRTGDLAAEAPPHVGVLAAPHPEADDVVLIRGHRDGSEPDVVEAGGGAGDALIGTSGGEELTVRAPQIGEQR